VQDSVEPHSGVPESRQCADDQQIGQGQRLGFQQVAQEGQVQTSELEKQGRADSYEQRRVVQGTRADPGARRNSKLGGAECEEGHALPWPPGGVAPDGHAQSHRRDHQADPDNALP